MFALLPACLGKLPCCPLSSCLRPSSCGMPFNSMLRVSQSGMPADSNERERVWRSEKGSARLHGVRHGQPTRKAKGWVRTKSIRGVRHGIRIGDRHTIYVYGHIRIHTRDTHTWSKAQAGETRWVKGFEWELRAYVRWGGVWYHIANWN